MFPTLDSALCKCILLCVHFPLGESYLETEIVLELFTSVTFVTGTVCGAEKVFVN